MNDITNAIHFYGKCLHMGTKRLPNSYRNISLKLKFAARNHSNKNTKVVWLIVQIIIIIYNMKLVTVNFSITVF